MYDMQDTAFVYGFYRNGLRFLYYRICWESEMKAGDFLVHSRSLVVQS